jgi:hypothetical protein
MATKEKNPIPCRLRIGNKKYSVEIVEAMLKKAWQGSIQYDNQRIQIARNSNVSGRRFKDHEMHATFWHELTHAILHDMDHSLHLNERFVEDFSTRLAQAVKTARF